nr:MAG TPA: hypothetical protein [Caudoviricetes sp.]
MVVWARSPDEGCVNRVKVHFPPKIYREKKYSGCKRNLMELS